MILVYDFGERRVAKMLKLCRKYLNWIQNSVFEGEISEARLKEMLTLCKKFMKEEEDSIIIFSSMAQLSMEKRVIGRTPASVDVFL